MMNLVVLATIGAIHITNIVILIFSENLDVQPNLPKIAAAKVKRGKCKSDYFGNLRRSSVQIYYIFIYYTISFSMFKVRHICTPLATKHIPV